MPRFWETAKFKRLSEKWEKRLEQAGFRDVEKTIGTDRVLSQSASNCYRGAPEIVRSVKQEYYDAVEEKLQTSDFKDGVELLVMLRVSEGIKTVDICRELKELGERCYKGTVRFIIRKYENAWGLRKWEKHQMTSHRVKSKRPI